MSATLNDSVILPLVGAKLQNIHVPYIMTLRKKINNVVKMYPFRNILFARIK